MAPFPALPRPAAAVLLGVGIGLFSSRADLLPANTPLHVVVALGNAIGPWVAVAFVVGAIQAGSRQGSVGGAIALAVGVATYYLAALLTWGPGVPSFLPQLLVVWLLVALIAGLAMGAVGGEWAAKGDHRSLGPMLLSGALLAEAAYRFIEVEGWLGIDLARTGVQIALADLIGAVIVPALLLDRRRWAAGYFGSLAIGVCGLGIVAGTQWLIRLAISGMPA
jgi:hypothetical protein